MNAPEFLNRWLIQLTLTTESELHLGDGGEGEVYDRTRSKNDAAADRTESDASTVCVDHRGRAFIPGSSIKGALRAGVAKELADEKKQLEAWCRRNPQRASAAPEPRPSAPWTDLLGFEDADSSVAVGGKLVFFDAFHTQAPAAEDLVARARNQDGDWNRRRLAADQQDDRDRPFWDPIRRTCVAVSNSLDRRLKSSKENLLYHLEYVPAGESFQLEIGGENLTDHEVGLLLDLLRTFNEPAEPRTTLGGLESSGWGKFKWKDGARTDLKVFRLTAANLDKWARDALAGFAACTEAVDPEKLPRHTVSAVTRAERTLRITLTLTLDSPWLVRDPRQRDRSDQAKRKQTAEEAKPPDAIPLRDSDGAYLPAKSLRGALRSRAELILRTLGRPCAAHPAELPAVTTKHQGPAGAVEQVSRTDLAARLFGLPGWRAPLVVSRFVPPRPPATHKQEFVAVDRFTGGAAEKLKFNAELAGSTTLAGTLEVDLDRLHAVDSQDAAIGLLALVLRDLAEGDIPIGSGSAKGQGTCTADATVCHSGADFASLQDWFVSAKVESALNALRHPPPPTPS